MDIWSSVEIRSFLKERKEKLKPAQANMLGLKRLEKIDFFGNIHVVEDKHTNTDMIIIKNGDLVISGINVEKGALVVYEGIEDILATIHYSAYEFDSNQIDIEYLKWFLKSNVFLNMLKEQSGGGIKTELKPKQFLPLKILLPNLETQKDISKKISSVSEEINDVKKLNNDNNTTFSLLRQSILQEAVQGKLVPQDPNDEPASELLKKIQAEKERLIKEKKIKKENPLPPIKEEEIHFELPEKWKWIRLGDICYKISDGTHQPPNFVEEGIPFLLISNIRNGYINWNVSKFISESEYELLYRHTDVCKGDILYTAVGSYGIAILIKTDKKFSFQRHIAFIKPVKESIYSPFLTYLLNSNIAKYQADSSARGIAQKTITLSDLKIFVLPLPPLSEQKRIVAKVDQLMQLCDDLEASIIQAQRDSERLMKTVLQEAFGAIKLNQ